MTAARRTVLATALAGAVSLAGIGVQELATSAAAARPAVREVRTIGHTVEGRDIRAFRLGDAHADRTVVLIGVMHGTERAPARTLRTLRDGRRPVAGVNLWVIPVLNIDGSASGQRANARGVDLNRNFPQDWSRSVTGAGRSAGSEPETRALTRFLNQIDPDVVVSLHQPFAAVDTSVSKTPRLARALSRELNLPRRRIACGGPCHGTLTGWFNTTHDGEAITVEFGPSPSLTYVKHTAVLGLLAAVGGRLA
ncbi:MAG TPA: M14 family zinc carboxypeptidase [Sporichthya sp.]|nr:M14 family zinc carboxypeptidase [Sporichthya sp.]